MTSNIELTNEDNMDIQTRFFDAEPESKDIVYTPDRVSKHIVRYLSPSGVCLDPCRGIVRFIGIFQMVRIIAR